MSHHTSHNLIATCHICNTTFQRMSALSSHLDNADNPTVCWNCSQCFSNVWELNKHEEHCLSSADESSDLASNVELRLSPSPGTSGNRVDYELGRPLDSDDVSTDESTNDSSDDDDDDSEFDPKAAQVDLSDTESDEESNSSTTNPAGLEHIASRGNLILPVNTNAICKDCGRGPFSSIKLHLRYCTGYPGRLFQSSCCKAFFPSQEALKDHCLILYACEVCGQVFNKWVSHHHHQPTNKPRLRVVSFCPESMPKTCTICKSFFLNEKFFLAHVTRVHTSVVSTKLCIINKPSGLTDKKLPANVATKLIPKSVIKTEQDDEFSINAAAKITPNPFIKTEQDDGLSANAAAKITPKTEQDDELSANPAAKITPEFVIKTEQDDGLSANPAVKITPKPVIKTEQDDRCLADVATNTSKTVIKTEQDDGFLAIAAAKITSETFIKTEQDDGFLANVAAKITSETVIKTEQDDRCLANVATNTSKTVIETQQDDGFLANVAAEITSKAVIKTQQVLNAQHLLDHTYSYAERPDLACSAPLPTIVALLENQRQVLTKRTNTRAQRTCRQCGTVLRQPYLAVSHRYLHRGSRSHRCHCGRAFKHRLHLLRHRVQHAEAESYICVNCGNTFTGARRLAEHLRGNTWKTKKCRTKCNVPLACSCGHFFYRASAYIWHQIKNNVKTRNL
ncbi:zinc finger protein 91 [Syngnathus typhle]|uniref:zinc finger protein 91 n=1 Tax=Syngnathus typhle TaxID=161592 RepID=UPI002A6997AA|nr:zinc finger protein 91 [Syngnathus typhle]XP_061144719.1 zinc finger protein 91 [Syngnathus typhle]XP_061144721.1 zinc finger protein 91 [Syngnathus typhle]